MNHHAFFNWRLAGFDFNLILPFPQFHDTQSAVAVGPLQTDVVTQMRHIDILLGQRLQDGQILIDFYFSSVDIHFDSISIYN
ncbi:hypothetical protein SDC9_199010 [bioreactor metagenome]|uniref:Uncharacterized protein n=1 Tax=bioreactor metagenome TaxID=1076179 RepID=A0A645IJA3_9ZZZZ